MRLRVQKARRLGRRRECVQTHATARRGVPRSSIMNVGRRVDYAVRALCYLAAQPPSRLVSRAEIQRCQQIPPHFLSKILRALVAGGLLRSVPGVRGGFRLGRPPASISLRAVYESVEGPLSLIDCVLQRESFCRFAAVCTQIGVWSEAQDILRGYLEGISLSTIADRQGLVARLARSRRAWAPTGGCAPKVA